MTLETTKPSTFSTTHFDTRELRDALGTFATGITIVTALDQAGAPIGFTANSFTSVSLDPPLVLVCIAKSAAGYGAFISADAYCVTVLSNHQRDISNAFAKRGVDKFDGVSWTCGDTGAPILKGGLAHFECAMHQAVDAGDHAILIGRVIDFATSDQQPLCYHRGMYAALAPEYPKPVNYVASRTGNVTHLNQKPVQSMGDQS